MRKWTITVLMLSLVMLLGACGSKNTGSDNGAAPDNVRQGGAPREVELKIGASSVPHAQILQAIKPELEGQGIRLHVVEFNDYIQPNQQVYDKELDANFFQHEPYLESENKKRGMDLVKVVGVHIEPFAAYSQKIKAKEEITDGAKIAIPNDATNGGRALILLADQGLIELKDKTNIESTIKDITSNPKNLKFVELDAAQLPRQLSQVDVALINTNYALQAQLNPKDALFMEDQNSPYVNILVSRPDNKDSKEIQALAKALTSEKARKYIEDRYNGSIIPAF
ncbi:MetQ/NlpA family ABC transporter substrate-binding protein [Paenibacillus sp. JX-17]|uniref:Lipoprotein n=1 Tax=Paenibacillus lacisoli TaxID=3064525 RepID=A0ABT9CCV6_9BACL|nr:MetQ/NlpA family ABC transporter substrate-binding protein [Paenibacillus sp. JX-17]MDO7907066.1 MetQ/NlpA family ABC transporter substrate-binding protein [Paenibacillus sp. JX-17]